MRGLRRLVPAMAVAAVVLSACGGDGDPAGDKAGDKAAAESKTPSGRVGDYPLHFLEPFPDLSLYSLDGEKVRSASLIGDRPTVVMLVSTSCAVCAELVETWSDLRAQIPDTIDVVAIVDEDLEFARDWADLENFSFPLYVDTRSAFALRHGVSQYPTVVGVAADGTILYVRRGVSYMFTPPRAADLLGRGAEERLKREREGSESDG